MWNLICEYDETTGEYFSRQKDEFDGYDPNDESE